MSTKHTPGPWRVDMGDYYDDGATAAGPEKGFEPVGGCGCCGSPWLNGKTVEARAADARLIAAAPDLLEALEAIVWRVNEGEGHSLGGDVESIAIAAIKQATGESA